MFYIFAVVAVFAGLFVYGLTLKGIFTSLFLVCLAACSAADSESGKVPDLIIISIALLGILNFFIVESYSSEGLISRLIGFVIVSVPMLILALLIKGAFGGGDIKLMAAAGLYLGWKYVLAGFVAGLFVAGIYSTVMLLFKKIKPHSKIRIVPFLSIGLGGAVLYGDLLIWLVTGIG